MVEGACEVMVVCLVVKVFLVSGRLVICGVGSRLLV